MTRSMRIYMNDSIIRMNAHIPQIPNISTILE
jgi:hypothetical protein